MSANELLRWGLLLDVLSEMSDVERQLVVQGTRPGTFVPDDLLERWYETFQGGRGFLLVGVSDVMLSILLEFDYYLDQLIEVLPETADDKEDYIRHDEAWQAVREMADWTLARIAEQGTPDELGFSPS